MKIAGVFKRLSAVLGQYIEDLLIFLGLFFIVYTTFTVDWTAGMYCLGVCLFGLGVYFTRHPIEKRR